MDIVLYYSEYLNSTLQNLRGSKSMTQKYIKWTLDPAKSCLVPEALLQKKSGSYERFIYNTETVFKNYYSKVKFNISCMDKYICMSTN